ncbi:MAG: alpha-amylase family glycosyl hydrolase, partial [bacterium]
MKKKALMAFILFLTGFGFFACENVTTSETTTTILTTTTTIPPVDLAAVNPEAGIYYEIFVRSFADSDGDGVGDFNGITAKLGYLQSLGVKGIWLMPIHPSPSYHGYDVTDYYAVNSDYGTMANFENLIAAATEADIRIMLDMPFNHTSSQHPWFQAALAGDDLYRNYYNFIPATTDTSSLLGSWGQDIWHPAGSFQYCGYFSSSMPDLNFYNYELQLQIFDIAQFWVDKGVKGFRLDAVHHLYGENEYPEQNYDYTQNIAFLTDLKAAIDDRGQDIYVIGEIYEESLYQVVAAYFDGLDSPLDFPIAAKIRNSVVRENNFGYAASLQVIYNLYRTYNENFISAPFIVNHDMNRLASQVSGNLTTMKLAAEMLLVLPGNPIIYYGEELGMYGSKASGPNIWDETRRMPFLWGDAMATDWIVSSSATLAFLESENAALDTAEVQMEDAESLLSFYAALLALRNDNIALAYGNSFVAYDTGSTSLQG